MWVRQWGMLAWQQEEVSNKLDVHLIELMLVASPFPSLAVHRGKAWEIWSCA